MILIFNPPGGGGGGSGDMILASLQTVTGAKTFNSGTLLLAGATSGVVTFNAPAVAGITTITTPGTTGTLALTTDIVNPAAGLTDNILPVSDGANDLINSVFSDDGSVASITKSAAIVSVLDNRIRLGDIASVGNSTTIDLRDNLQSFRLFNSVTSISANAVTGVILLGDIDAAGNLITVKLDDPNETITLAAPIIQLADAGTAFSRLNFGGATSSFPALKRSSAKLIVRLADDSANAHLEVLDDAYNATTWNGNNDVPTKNAVRDIIETIIASGVSDGDKGDITVSGSGAVWTIDNGVVTLAKQADVATSRLLGRVTAGAGVPEALTGTQATTLLDEVTSSLKGLAPASGGGTTNFLRADGTWAAPPTGSVSDGDKGDITVSSGGTVWTIDNNVVTNAKADDMAVNTIKGRITTGTGDPEDLTAANVRTIINVADGANNYTHPNHSGDVTSVGDGAQTIAADAVTNAKLANMASSTIKGRVTAGTGDPEDLTGTQATTLLDVFTSTLKGLAPSSGGGTTNYLRADGSWASPPGTGLSDGDKGDITVSASGATWTIDNDVVTNAKSANMAVNTIKGRITTGTGDPEDLTAANVRTIINVADGANFNITEVGALPGTSTVGDSFLLNNDRWFISSDVDTLREVPMADTTGSSANQVLGLNSTNNAFETKTVSGSNGTVVTHGTNSIAIETDRATTTEVLTGTSATKMISADALAALWEKGSDISSAGTITIGEGGYFVVTGTTTITDIDFGTDKTGRMAWLHFTGALTLTHNATTLILPTGANITTAVGDTALIVSEGSDAVKCICYMRKDGTALAGGGGGGTTSRSLSMLNGSVMPDSSGNVWFDVFDAYATNDVWKSGVWVFGSAAAAQPTTRIGLFGTFTIPDDYDSGGTIRVTWTSDVTSGNRVWDFDYRTVGGDDTTSLDQTGTEESVSVTDAAPGASWRRLTAALSPTTSNFAAGETVEWGLFLDGTDASDTLAGRGFVFDLLFRYTGN